MKTTVNETVSQETGPILQLNRGLLSIGEYAVREGVTKGIIEECGKLGIIPIRKHKGKTFVVDVPIHSYSDKYEIAGIPTPTADKGPHARKISELAEKYIPDTPETTDRTPQSDQRLSSKTIETDDWLAQFAADIDRNGTVFKTIQKDFPERLEIANQQTAAIDNEIELTEEITRLHTEAVKAAGQSAPSADDNVNRDKNILKSTQTSSPESPETNDQPMAAAEQSSQPENLPEIIQTPELQASKLQTSEIIDDLPDFIDEAMQIQDILESVQTAPDDGVQLGILAARTRSKYRWQTTAVLSLVCLFTAIFINLWLYTDRRVQLDRVSQAYAGVQEVYDDYTQTSKHAETIQNELDSSRADAKRIQNELYKATAELKRVRNELALARQSFEKSRQYNAEAVGQLHEQIQNLATRLANLAENP